ncbi:hypothetical protein EMIHUDRAFT_437476 [Emiliania huxleyi CCMP1516]|uniref:Hexosyltransferase n=2 Tax=Emiliania huxleyi TaxID=2903 RepID=A0A0D3IKN2_EMIH1|nr:hypothetical protein EMIHUDRAFT_437476 [Emiliania huxleyi CCMP1516]EOD11817.1 hypothetical protein EMIHUDRAFT_437476 [Emiliania huxleyi CCMP1516]|eukprot:XP_005764246.1 hypothetical protein EMIHUDRAFT_437476 [Emiliania huxleyi CCMP1516]
MPFRRRWTLRAALYLMQACASRALPVTDPSSQRNANQQNTEGRRLTQFWPDHPQVVMGAAPRPKDGSAREHPPAPAIVRMLGQPNHTAIVLRTAKTLPMALIDACYVRDPLPAGHDMWVLHNMEQPNSSMGDQLVAKGVNAMVYTGQNVRDAFGQAYNGWLHYTPGLVLLLLSAPAYQYVWAIEDDTLFTGRLPSFLISQADYTEDFIGAHKPTHGSWMWGYGTVVPREADKVKTKVQVYRLSARLLRTFDDMLQLGLHVYVEGTASICYGLRWCSTRQLPQEVQGTRFEWNTKLTPRHLCALGDDGRDKWQHKLPWMRQPTPDEVVVLRSVCDAQPPPEDTCSRLPVCNSTMMGSMARCVRSRTPQAKQAS